MPLMAANSKTAIFFFIFKEIDLELFNKTVSKSYAKYEISISNSKVAANVKFFKLTEIQTD